MPLQSWRSGSGRAGFALLIACAAAACGVLALQLAADASISELLSVLGINLGFFAELRVGQYAPGFPTGGDVQWLNSEPLDMKELQAEGEWMLIHFWDSTSVESLRTLPAVSKMHEYYGREGLRVVGVHRPRYDFARSPMLLVDAVDRLKLDYPVVNDVDADVAHAWGVQKLDTMFLVNSDNLIVGRKSGREASAEMLSAVCKALASHKPTLACLADGEDVTTSNVNSEGTPQQGLYTRYYGNPNFRNHQRCHTATPDVYVGEARASSLDVGTSAGRGSLTPLQSYSSALGQSRYSDMSGVRLNDGAFVLSGAWVTHKEGMVATADPETGFVDTHLRLRYHGKAAYALMGVAALEEGNMDMCANGVSGNAKAGAACLKGSPCQDFGGAEGRYGWCFVKSGDEELALDSTLHEIQTRLDVDAGEGSRGRHATGTQSRKLLADSATTVGAGPFFMVEKGTLHEVRAACQKAGGDLASIHSKREAEEAAQACPHKYCYIGAMRDGYKKPFYWMDGSPFDYTAWAKSQPNGNKGETSYEKAVVWTDGAGGHWHDWGRGNDFFPGVCKKHPPPPPPPPPVEWGGCEPCEKAASVKVYLLLDGVPVPRSLRGKDVVEDAFGRTYVSVWEPRVYTLISDTHVSARGLELIPASEGVAFNQFSFASNCASDLPPLG